MGKGSMKNLGMVGRSEFKRINCDEHKGGGERESFHENPEGKGELLYSNPRVSTVDSSIYRVRCDQAPKGN